MICYKPTSGCGVYENRSCGECPYSKPLIKPLIVSEEPDESKVLIRVRASKKNKKKQRDLKEKFKDKEINGSNS